MDSTGAFVSTLRQQYGSFPRLPEPGDWGIDLLCEREAVMAALANLQPTSDSSHEVQQLISLLGSMERKMVQGASFAVRGGCILSSLLLLSRGTIQQRNLSSWRCQPVSLVDGRQVDQDDGCSGYCLL
eukprot:m.94422 g.94422  ORF g.94422 m.94422 type:complete len:128 (-) comp15002_c0_seq43:855-1238(-)